MQSVPERFHGTVRRLTGSLSPAVLRVATFMDQNRAAVLASSAAQIAARLETSDATVIRTVQALGYDGLPDLKQALATEMADKESPASNMRRTLRGIGPDIAKAIGAVLDAHQEGMKVLNSEEGRADLVAAVKVLHPAARIGVFGIGPSAHLARYLSSQLHRAGRQTFLLDATGWALADQLMQLQPKDGLLLLSYGKPYPEVLAVVSEARRMELAVVLVTDAVQSEVASHARVVVTARRGRTSQAALHAVTLAALEGIVLGLATVDQETAIAQLDDLGRLRRLVSGR